MAYEGPETRDGIRDALEARYDKVSRTTRVLLGGEDVGQVVTYGKKDMLKVPRNGLRPTVFNGRVNIDGIRISVEASSQGSMLNALATQIGKTLRAAVKARAPRTEDGATTAVASGPKP